MTALEQAQARYLAAHRELLAAVKDLGDTMLGDAPICPLGIRIIQNIVAARHKLPLDSMWSPERPNHIALPRQTAMFLARVLTGHSLAKIGMAFLRDHGTVIHAVRAVENRQATEADFSEELRILTDECEQAIELTIGNQVLGGAGKRPAARN